MTAGINEKSLTCLVREHKTVEKGKVGFLLLLLFVLGFFYVPRMFKSICPTSVLSFLLNSHTHFLSHFKKVSIWIQARKYI